MRTVIVACDGCGGRLAETNINVSEFGKPATESALPDYSVSVVILRRGHPEQIDLDFCSPCKEMFRNRIRGFNMDRAAERPREHPPIPEVILQTEFGIAPSGSDDDDMLERESYHRVGKTV